MITILHRGGPGGQAQMITDYIGGEGSAETPKNDYVIYGRLILLPSDLSSAIQCSRSTHARCMPNTLVPPLKSYSPKFSHFCLKSSSLHPPRVKHGHPSIFHICQRILSIWLTFKTSSVSLNNQFIFSASPSKPSITSVHLNISLSPNFAPWSRKCILIKLLRKKVHSLWW